MDFYNDTCHKIFELIGNIRSMPGFVKSANIIDKESIPDHMFAYPEKRAYSIADPASTYISFGYWMLNNDSHTQNENNTIKSNLLKAAQFFGVEKDLHGFAKKCIEYKEDSLQKQAEDNYGLPETKSYPLHTEDHVTLAMDHFPKHHFRHPIEDRVKIAQKIIKKASEFNIPVKHQVISQYGSMPFCEEKQAVLNVASRSLFAPDNESAKLYNLLGNAMIGNMQPSILIKVANTLDSMDSHFGINTHGLPNPYNSIFNMTEKQALQAQADKPININGSSFLLDDLARIPGDFYEESMGQEFVDAVIGDNGIVDPDKLDMIINTLPLPEKNILVRYLNQYFASQNGV